MKSTEETNRTEVVITDKNDNTRSKNNLSNNQNSSTVNNITSQRQLLSLAHQFSLDDGLRSNDKKLPIDERVTRFQQSCKVRRQKNLESILKQALTYSSDDEITDKADIDWFNSFILLAENISNATMQALWAKILAGELARPGSFSLKALKVFKDMSISDAKLLAKAHRIATKDPANNNLRIITGCYQKPNFFSLFMGDKNYPINLAEFGLNYSDILALANNNLLFSQEAETRPLSKGGQVSFNFHLTNLSLESKINEVCIKFYKFTAIGNELAQLITDTPNAKYLDNLKLSLQPLFLLN